MSDMRVLFREKSAVAKQRQAFDMQPGTLFLCIAMDCGSIHACPAHPGKSFQVSVLRHGNLETFGGVAADGMKW